MDRVFKQEDITSLCDDLNSILTECEGYIEELEETAQSAKDYVLAVPKEGRTTDIDTAATSYTSAAENVDSARLKTKLTQTGTRVGHIVSEDAKYAADTNALKEQVEAVTRVLRQIDMFLETTSLDTAHFQFKNLLVAERQKWNSQLTDAKKVVRQIKANTKGAEAKSIAYRGDPVNMSSGNFIYHRTDIEICGEDPFLFRRFYNAINTRSGVLGSDWNHNYEVYLEDEDKEKVLILEEGKEERFLKTSTGSYVSLYHSNGTLEEIEEGYVYKTTKQVSYYFDKEGNCLRQEVLNGTTTSLNYEDVREKSESVDEVVKKRLVRVARGTGEFFTLSYDESGYLQKVSDHTGRTITYQMQGDKLSGICTPSGHWLRYGYSLAGKLESIVNARGITNIENEYDEQMRTIKQTYPDGTTERYEYDDDNKAVTFFARNESKTTFLHDEQLRDIRHIYKNGEESFEYNKLNQKTLVVDKLGNKTKLGYDEMGNLTQVINPLGEKTKIAYEAHNQPTYIEVAGEVKAKNTYNEEGKLIETKDGLGNAYTFAYNEKNKMQEITQPDGSKIRIAYDEKGNISTFKDASGNETTYCYDACNQVTGVTDALGNTTNYIYDIEGNIKKVINAAGKARCYTYNESNKVTEIEDFDGSKIRQEYNVLNKPEKLIDALGRETLITYDVMWNLARVIEPSGNKTTYLYNEYNNLGRIRNGKGDLIRYTYDAVGNRTQVEDEEGNKTKFTYDALRRLTQVEEADGSKTTYTYNNQGQVSKVTDALGNEVNLRYDSNGNLIKETAPMGEERSYTYTSLGNVKTITNEAGLITTYEYEIGGRLKSITYPDKQSEHYTYDAIGRLVTYTNREGVSLTYSYDELGQVIQIEGSDKAIKSYTYDAKGNVTSFTDEKNNTTTYTYSVTGTLTNVVDALGNETTYTYDACDRLLSVLQAGIEKNNNEAEEQNTATTDADLQHVQKHNAQNKQVPTIRYERDVLGNVTKITDALGNQETFHYDKKSQLIEKVDKEGYLTTYAYNPSGEVVQIQYADGKEVRLSYNALRQLEEVEDWLGITRIENNPRGQATKVTYPDGKEVAYGYGAIGEKISVTYPDGAKVGYAYDELKRLEKVTDKVGNTTYAYDTKGHLKQKQYPNGIETLYAYTDKGQLASLTHQDNKGILDKYSYTYDIQGNKVQIEKQRRNLETESGIYKYGYDALQRLTEVTRDETPLRGYTYDARGNRSTSIEYGKTSSRYSYNAMNQLLIRTNLGIEGKQSNENQGLGNQQVGNIIKQESFTYDKRGNLTEIFKNNKLVNQYHFGALNRLERATNLETNEASIYQYNGLGHRVGRMIGSPIEPNLPTDKLQQLTINPTKQIEDTIDLTKQYHNLLQRREDGSATTSYTWDSNVLHAVGSGAKQQAEINTNEQNNYHYLQDELGSPIRLFSTDGSFEEMYGYDEFGQDRIGNNHTNSFMQPFTYTGYQKDGVASTYFAQAREYTPDIGRFTGEDIIKGHGVYPFTLNQYTYCWNHPTSLVDLDGLKPTPLDAAFMARHIYNASEDSYGNFVGSGWMLETIMPAETGGEKIGVYSKVNAANEKEYALVSKGTTTGSDWKNNAQQPFGHSEDMRESIRKAEEFMSENHGSEVTMIGHSKGGAEAAANALATGTNAILFNPATLFPNQYGLSTSDYNANMDVYIIDGEILTSTFRVISKPIDKVYYLDGPMDSEGVFSLINHSMEVMIMVLAKEQGENCQ